MKRTLLALFILATFGLRPACLADTENRFFMGHGSHGECLYMVDGEMVESTFWEGVK